VDVTFDGDVAGGDPAMFRCYDGSGQPAIVSLSVAGNVLTLQLDRIVVAPLEISYGYAQNPAADWLRDMRGTPVPIFARVPVAP
jgi:hypothetical protein